MEKVSRDPEVVSVMEKTGAEVLFFGGAIMGSFMAADKAKWSRLTISRHISIE